MFKLEQVMSSGFLRVVNFKALVYKKPQTAMYNVFINVQS